MAVEQNRIDMRATTAETISGLRGRNEGWFIGLGAAIHAALPPRRRPLARVLPTSLLPTTTLSKAHEAVESGHWLRALNVPAHCTVLLYLDRLPVVSTPAPPHSIFQNILHEIHDHANGVPSTGPGSRLFWPRLIIATGCVVGALRNFLRIWCADA